MSIINVLDYFSRNELVFRKKIVDSDNYFKIKFFVLHGQKEVLLVESLGRISGQGVIPIFDKSITDQEKRRKNKFGLYVIDF